MQRRPIPMQRRPARMAPALFAIIALALLAACGDEREPLSPRGQAGHLAGADTERGRRLVADYGCVACHVVPGVRGPATDVGPPLGHVARRAYLGGVIPNTPDNLVKWLLDPPAIDPRTAMPSVGLDGKDARDVAAYLLTLR